MALSAIFSSHFPNPQKELAELQLGCPALLLAVFCVYTVYHDISISRNEDDFTESTVRGPGGKPLPMNKRKREQDAAHEDMDFWSPLARFVVRWLVLVFTLSFLADGICGSIHIWNPAPLQEWYPSESRVVYDAGCFFLYFFFVYTLFGTRADPNIVLAAVWSLNLVLEILLIDFTFGSLSQRLDAITARSRRHHSESWRISVWQWLNLGTAAVRVVLLVGMVVLYCLVSTKKSAYEKRMKGEHQQQRDNDENAPLLEQGEVYNYQTEASSRPPTVYDDENDDEKSGFYRPKVLPHKTAYEYWKGYKVFLPYLWPCDKNWLQFMLLLCVLLVLAQRAVNVLVPWQVGIITDILTHEKVQNGMPWAHLVLLAVLKLLQGNSGVLGAARNLLWLPVSQYTYNALTRAAFKHVHSLSLDFHLSKKTGEILSALNKGESINLFLEQVTFQMVPMVIDLVVAIVVFYVKFGPLYAMFGTVISFYYLTLTIRMAATRSDQRRAMVNADREGEAIKNESITAYETVKYFNAEAFEYNRYDEAVKKYQDAEAQVITGVQMMNVCQTAVFASGLLIALTTCAYQVAHNSRTVGDFVLLLTYFGQLQGPLNFFGTFYKAIQSAMISGERLLELFKIRPTIIDVPEVPPQEMCGGLVEWDNVSFAYDNKRPALSDISFTAKPGTTTAFVGESGGGKSTVFRLMFRYYNSSSGLIKIDNRSVADYTVDSIRRFIGVVPQDTMLFNETIMYNLKYANPEATVEEVCEACRAAAIHDRIMSFPDQYETKVGERGMRMSGGEKQRLAIARTLLKKPKIIMLDEATSALDGATEQQIQSTILSGNLTKDGNRTVLVIAHRLSTITKADNIIVLHNGKIVESGTHESLLAHRGRYASMWDRHVQVEHAAEEARIAIDRARELSQRADRRSTRFSTQGFLTPPDAHSNGQT